MAGPKSPFLARLFYLAVVAMAVVGCATNETTKSEPAPVSSESRGLNPEENRLYLSALDKLDNGQSMAAESDLIELSQAHPDRLEIWINLATACYKGGKLDEAIDALSVAKELDPNIAEIHNLSGLIAVDRAEYQAAEQHYLAAIELDRDYSNAHYNLALLYDIFYQEIEKAVTHYERYLALTSSDDRDTANWVQQLKYALERDASR